MAALLPRISRWARRLVDALTATALRPMLALGLSLCLSLTACSGAADGLTGNYVDDTVSVAQTLLTTIALPQDDPGHDQAEADVRRLINDYMARYRPRRDVNGLGSFTTMQTALNSLAGHYANYANRPLPDALRSRLEKELQRASTSVVRGA
jgi:photosystem II Psb27 protein